MFGVLIIALGVFVFKTIEKKQIEGIQQQFIQQQEESIYVQEIVETDTGINMLNTGTTQKIIEEPVSITTENKESITKKLLAAGYKEKEVLQNNVSNIVLEGTQAISVAKNKQLPVSVVLKSTNTLQNKYAEAELPAGIYVKDKNNNSYEKEIEKPRFVDPKQYNLDNKEAVAMIDVGSDLESIFFEDEEGNPKEVFIRIPAPGYQIGSKANIYSSEDGKDWKFHTTAVVQNIENAPYVQFSTTHFTLFTVGSIQWDNDNFLTEEFWNNNPTDDQIIRALYGDGSGGVEKTAYTKYWTENTCMTGDMSVVYLSGGTGTIPLNLDANTIYILESGSYISTGSIQMTRCSSIVAKIGNVNLFSNDYIPSTTQGIIVLTSENNTILDNLRIDGEGDGLGGIHTKNQMGLSILYSSKNNTLHNIKSYNNSQYGIYIYSSSSYNLLDSIKTYNNGNIGIGIQAGSNYNILNSIQTYNNNSRGVYLSNSNYNNFNDIQIYNNSQYGLHFSSNANYNNFNDIQIYNNSQYGVYIYDFSNYNTLNNANIYNNQIGLYILSSSNNMFNNIQLYNNGQRGLYFNNSSNNILNQVYVLNNTTGISLGGTSTGNKYYGKLRLYENDSDWDGNIGGISIGDQATYSSLGWTGGYLDYSPCFRCSNITNPINIGSGVLTNTGIYWTCNSRGKIIGWTPNTEESINYIYGTNIPKQVQPVEYSGTEIVNSTLEYSGDLYIGEVNKIGENNDITCNNCDSQYSVSWNNDDFIDTGFWDQNPNSCDIIAALYGTGIYGEDQTAYSSNRSGAQNGNLCDVENMRVFTGSAGMGILPLGLPSNTIYILESGDYITTWTINTEKCNAIISKNGTSTFYSAGQLTNGMFYINQKKNNIFDNINIDGTGNGLGGSHSQNSYGIYLNYGLNNIINNSNIYNSQNGIWLTYSSNIFLKNIKSYNNTYRGITLRSSNNYNFIDSVQVYNNSWNGVLINSSNNYNVLNNIQSYNNSQYGIGLISSSNNSLNNIQSYNNLQQGLYISSSSNNVLNNIQSYNNLQQGIYLNNSNNNILNEIYILNNSTGFSILGTSTGNKYYGKLRLYENNIQWNGNTGGISNGDQNDYSSLGWTGGYLDYDPCFRCSNITNPININLGVLTNTGINWTCNSRGRITSWTPIAGESINYIYGTEIPKQIQPVQYSGSVIVNSNLEYSGNLYIGEVNKIGENNDTICNNCSSQYSVNWNNDNFIDSGFWSQNPNSCDILASLYGTGLDYNTKSIYIQNRLFKTNANMCNVENMKVLYTLPGTSTLPIEISNNTLYVLESGNYITTGAISLNNCSAIIGKYGNINIYSSISIPSSSQAIFYSVGSSLNNKIYNILDNLHIDGTNNGLLGTHTRNTNGIYLYYSRNNTFNNIDSINNGQGILLQYANNNYFYNSNFFENNGGYGFSNTSSSDILLDNINIFNNYRGFRSYGSSNNIINNSKIYNNSEHGFWSNHSSTHSLNNLKIFNNNKEGIILMSHTKGYFNNILIYNNGDNGLNLQTNNLKLSFNILNNISIYNNSGYGIYFEDTSLLNDNISINNIISNISSYNNKFGLYVSSFVTGNYIYNKLNIFGNDINISGSGENLILGSGDTYSYLGRTTGEINTGGTINRDILINPKNELGKYLLSWTGTWTGMIGRNTLYTGISTQTSYGSNISRQIQPVIWSGTELILSGEYDSNKYIGGDDVALTGILSGWKSTWHSSLLDLSYLTNSGLRYNLFGDVYVTTSGEVNTQISLLLSQGTGTKTLIGQLFDGDSFTHFVYTSDYVDLPYVDLLDVQNQQVIENELINGGYQETTGSIKGIQEGYFIGQKDIRLYHSNGALLVPIIMQSTGEQLVEIQLLSGTIFKTEDNQPYTGVVSIPIQTNPLESGLSGAIAAIFVGSDVSLQLKDDQNESISSIIRIPVIADIGEHIDIYYSEDDGENWLFHTGTTIVSLSGLSYVEFTTTHFTDFAIVGVGELPPEPLTGSFVINNDDEYTLTGNVTLSLDTSGATDVRFQNEGEEWSEWFTYTGTYQWTLTGGYGVKIVYVEIDFDHDLSGDILTSDSILYSELPPGQQGGNITLEITGGITECVYGTSLYLGAQDVTIDPSGYTFSGDFSPSSWYCADFKGFDGWAFSIHTSDLSNEKSNIISGSNVLISHNPPVVQGHDSCTGYNGAPTSFNNGTGLVLMEKSNVPDNKKICRVDISNVKLEVNVPPYQAPGNYSGTLTITIPNGFNE